MLSDDQRKTLDKRDKKVMQSIRKNGSSFSDLQVKTALEPNLLRGSLKRLRESRRVTTLGLSRHMKYIVRNISG